MAEKKKKAGRPRTRMPVAVASVEEPETTEETSEEPEDDVVESKRLTANVELVVGRSLRKFGMTYQSGKRFVVTGREAIDFYKKDGRFKVTE